MLQRRPHNHAHGATSVLIEVRSVTPDNVDRFESELFAIARENLSGMLVVDFRNVDVLGECGLAVMTGARGMLKKAGGTLRLCGLNEHIREKLAITRLDRLFEIFPTEAEALTGEPPS